MRTSESTNTSIKPEVIFDKLMGMITHHEKKSEKIFFLADDIISLYELLQEPWIFSSFNESKNFALKWSNYYDLHNEIYHNTKDEFYVVFTEQEND